MEASAAERKARGIKRRRGRGKEDSLGLREIHEKKGQDKKLHDTNHGTRYDSKASSNVSFNLSSAFGLGCAPRKQAPTI